MYIYEHENWPDFFWNQENIADLLIPLRYQQGCLMGGMESIGFHLRQENVLQNLTQEVMKSSEIEGEILDQSLVRSSVARHLGIEIAALHIVDRNVEGVVEMILDATQRFDQPLTKERLFNWHAALFPNGGSGFKKIRVGAWRTGLVQVISGQMGKEKIHFEAPPAERVDHEMEIFLDWLNHETRIDLVLKAAIAHLWFVTIHPFDDGNGRIGRAIADLMLARSERSSCRFYSLSAQIQRERKHYYAILEQTQKGTLDITSWIEWFFGCLGRAIENALSALGTIIQKTKFWETLAEISLNERQRTIINLLLVHCQDKIDCFGCVKAPRLRDRKWVSIDLIQTHFRSLNRGSFHASRNSQFYLDSVLDGFDGKLTSSKWAKITKCSQDTAYRDILELIERGILTKNPEKGRSTSYSLVIPKSTI